MLVLGFVQRPLLLRLLLQQLHDLFLRLQLSLFVMAPELGELLLQRLPFRGAHSVPRALRARLEVLPILLVQVLSLALHSLLLFLRLQRAQVLLDLVFNRLLRFLVRFLFFLGSPLRPHRVCSVQDIRHPLELVGRCITGGRVAINVLQVLVGVALQQLQHHRQMPVVRGIVQRRVAMVVRDVHRDVGHHAQGLYNVFVTSTCSLHQRGSPTVALVGQLRVRARAQQRRRALPEALGGSIDQGRVSAVVPSINEVPVPQIVVREELPHNLGVPIVGREDQGCVSVLLHVAIDVLRYLTLR
mmetsp:Transcript_66767/g.159344  ORF Transcript_66767/g.159344 Transcript_66767/m.159344 type:complete len:300 (-) Transcript_66767:503-1402(-)